MSLTISVITSSIRRNSTSIGFKFYQVRTRREHKVLRISGEHSNQIQRFQYQRPIPRYEIYRMNDLHLLTSRIVITFTKDILKTNCDIRFTVRSKSHPLFPSNVPRTTILISFIIPNLKSIYHYPWKYIDIDSLSIAFAPADNRGNHDESVGLDEVLYTSLRELCSWLSI